MPKCILSCFACLLALVFAPYGQRLAAQVTPPRIQGPVTRQPGTAGAQHVRQQPCWEVAGISKSAMEQRRGIQQRTRSEIEAVCADAALSPQQRQQRIRQIHEQSKHELDALVSPQQMQSLKSCQMSRGHGGGHPGMGHPGVGGGHGPCGELPAKEGPKSPPGEKSVEESDE